MNEYLEKVYEQIKNIMIENAHIDENDDIFNYYKKYLYNTYDVSKIDSSFYYTILKMETSHWKNKNRNTIENFLVPDKALNELNKISSQIEDMCNDRIDNNILIDEKTYNEIKQKMEENIKNVRDYNKEYAAELIADNLLDLDYAAGKENITSIRMMGTIITKNK